MGDFLPTSLMLIRYPEIAEQKIAETKRPARSFSYNQPADISYFTARQCSILFGIQEPLSIFNTEFFNIDFIQYGGPIEY